MKTVSTALSVLSIIIVVAVWFTPYMQGHYLQIPALAISAICGWIASIVNDA